MTYEKLKKGNELKASLQEIAKFVELIETSSFKSLSTNGYSITVPDNLTSDYLDFMGKCKESYLELLERQQKELMDEFESL